MHERPSGTQSEHSNLAEFGCRLEHLGRLLQEDPLSAISLLAESAALFPSIMVVLSNSLHDRQQEPEPHKRAV